MSFFETVTLLPDDPIMQLPIAFGADLRPHKVNLGIGAYRDAEGRPLVLNCVKQAEKALVAHGLSYEYLPIGGLDSFLQAAAQVVYGQKLAQQLHAHMYLSQTLGGTGALRLGGEFLVQQTSKAIFLPHPSWANHKIVFGGCGLKVHHYRYFDMAQHSLDFAGMCADVENMPPGSTLLLHAGCHNPTGIDLAFEQWQHLSRLVKKLRLIPFFDFAYQGFDVSVEDDAKPVRYFAEQGHEMLVASSFSKNFGLYNARVGLLSVLTGSQEAKCKVGSQIKRLVRGSYSNPPRYGAQLVADILANAPLKHEWLQELASMRHRMVEMRQALMAGLQAKSANIDWSYIVRQKGFFSFCGLNQKQTQRLLHEYAIYMPADGRINIAGLTAHNIDYVISSIIAVMES